jgi:uracil DNA glycosylase
MENSGTIAIQVEHKMSQFVDVAIAAETAYSTRATALTLCFSVVRVPRSLRNFFL